MKRHRVDMLSLIAGVVFVVFAAAFASDSFDVRWLRLEWLGAVALLGIGLAVLISTRRNPAAATGAAADRDTADEADTDVLEEKD